MTSNALAWAARPSRSSRLLSATITRSKRLASFEGGDICLDQLECACLARAGTRALPERAARASMAGSLSTAVTLCPAAASGTEIRPLPAISSRTVAPRVRAKARYMSRSWGRTRDPCRSSERAPRQTARRRLAWLPRRPLVSHRHSARAGVPQRPAPRYPIARNGSARRRACARPVR